MLECALTIALNYLKHYAVLFLFVKSLLVSHALHNTETTKHGQQTKIMYYKICSVYMSAN